MGAVGGDSARDSSVLFYYFFITKGKRDVAARDSGMLTDF